MNSMSQAVATAVKNPIPSKSPRRENRKSALPVAPAVQAAPVVSAPKAKAQEAKPEVIFMISDRAKLEASKYAARLTAFASDPKVHRDHTTQVLATIFSLKKNSFTLSEVISALDRPLYEEHRAKSDRLLRSYVSDNLETLLQFGISKQAAK